MTAQGAPLSPCEKEVLALLCQGLKDKEIALQLGIDDKTVRTHVSRACEKLGALNRVQLGRLAPPPSEGG